MSVLATRKNMREYAIPPKRIGQLIVTYPQPFAYSAETDERYSASEGDYFLMSDDEPLRDSEGNEMYLMREITRLVDVDEDDD